VQTIEIFQKTAWWEIKTTICMFYIFRVDKKKKKKELWGKGNA